MPDPVEGQVVVDETPPLKAPLVAADSTTNNIERVDDVNNRTTRSLGASGGAAAVAWFLQKFTGISAEEAILIAPFVAAAFTWTLNQLERRGYIRGLKPDEATISPPRTTTGQLLGQSTNS
jgi:hypothetical protein